MNQSIIDRALLSFQKLTYQYIIVEREHGNTIILEFYKRAMCSDIDRRFPCSIGSALLDCTNNFDTNVIEFKRPEMRAVGTGGSTYLAGYLWVGRLCHRPQKRFGIGPVLSKRLETRFKDGHRHPVVEVSTPAPGTILLTMIELDVTGSELLVGPILMPATRPPAVRRGELNTKLVVLRFAWSPLDLEIAIGTGAEIGAVDPREDCRRAKRARLGTNLVDARGSS